MDDGAVPGADEPVIGPGPRATWAALQVAGRISAGAAGPLAARLWFTPWRVPMSEAEGARRAEWLRDTTPFVVSAAPDPLRGYLAGEGPTVLLVHGWGDSAATLGGFVRPLVEAGWRVAAVDLPAHGDARRRETTVFEMADALVETAAYLGGVRAVVGHSMGGLVTLVALRDRLRAEATVLIAPAVRLEDAVAKFRSMFRLPSKAVAGLRREIDRRFGPDIWADLAADRLVAGLPVRGLVIHDRDDRQVPFDLGASVAAAWPAPFVATEGLGHRGIVRDPEVIAKVADFVASTGAGRLAASEAR